MLKHLGAYLASNFLVAAPPPAKAAYLSTLYGLVLLIGVSKLSKQRTHLTGLVGFSHAQRAHITEHTFDLLVRLDWSG